MILALTNAEKRNVLLVSQSMLSFHALIRVSRSQLRYFSITALQSSRASTDRRSWQLDTEGRTLGFARRRSGISPRDEEQPHPAAPAASSTYSSSNSSSGLTVSQTLQDDENDANGLVAPVNIPADQFGILVQEHPASSILANSSIVVQRQLEMMNVFLGFEQANRYVIMDPSGSHIGYMAEQDHGLGNVVARQAFRTHRSFTTHVFDRGEKEVLRFHRPFSWISSKIRVYDAFSQGHRPASTESNDSSTQMVVRASNAHISSMSLSQMRIIGEAQQQWAPLRRKYNLFLHRDCSESSANSGLERLTSGELPSSSSKEVQVAGSNSVNLGFSHFAHVDEPFLSWDFALRSEKGKFIGSVNRNFVGFARELLTDTGVYALRMDSVSQSNKGSTHVQNGFDNTGMTLDQRAVMLATAVSIDFDYFSRHSHTGTSGIWPMWIPWGGGAGAGAGAGGVEAGGLGAAEAGAGVRGAASEVGRAGEGAIAGAGTMAGYEMMQRQRERYQESQTDISPQNTQQLDEWGSPQNQDGGHAWPSPASNQQNEESRVDWDNDQGGIGSQGGSSEGGGDFFDDLF